MSEPVGKCPNHGVVFGEDLEYNFPNPSSCNQCGEQVEETVMASEKQIQQHK